VLGFEAGRPVCCALGSRVDVGAAGPRGNGGRAGLGHCCDGIFSRIQRERAAVGKVWYESNRESDNVVSSSLAIKFSNTICWCYGVDRHGPIFGFLGRSVISTAVGTVRYVSNVFGLHLGLLVCRAHIFDSYLLRQTRLFEQLKLIVLIAVVCGRAGVICGNLSHFGRDNLVWQMCTPR